MAISTKTPDGAKNKVSKPSESNHNGIRIQHNPKYDHVVQIGWGLDRYLGGNRTKEALKRKDEAHAESHH